MDYKEKVIALLNSQELSNEQKEKLESIFPELKESDDERIRKAMIDFFKHEREEGITVLHYGVNIECMLAWLEKQGEQKPTDEEMKTLLQTEYEKGRADAIAEMQKHWSEEDESILQGIWDEILANKHHAKEYEWKTYDKFLNWLKSLRPQNRWKPSDEQMSVIEAVINNRSFQRRHLDSLYADLKKLKDEK